MLSWLALCSLLWCSSSEAALNLMRTRVIYEGSTEARLMVRNDGSEPSLLQAWVDGGNEQQGTARGSGIASASARYGAEPPRDDDVAGQLLFSNVPAG